MKTRPRRNGFIIMFNLLKVLGKLSLLIIIAVINGALGFLSSIGVTFFGVLALAKYLGETIPLSYELLMVLAVTSGVVRGALRYIEQYTNHYIAFRLLAIIRDKIFKAVRRLGLNKMNDHKKGDIISMITSDIETLEVFYAHTISPIGIALLTFVCVFMLIGFLSSWYLTIVYAFGQILLGIILPIIGSHFLKTPGVNYRKEFANFNSYFLDSIRGVKEIIIYGDEEKRLNKINENSYSLLKETKILKRRSELEFAVANLFIGLIIAVSLVFGYILVKHSFLTPGTFLLGIDLIFSSFSPALALSSLPGSLNQTLASGDRVLKLLKEKPTVEEIKNGTDFVYDNLRVENLSFAYDGKTILKNVNFEIRKNEIVGIVGPSGCGKTTFLNLLLRFNKKSEGAILYNGIDIENINTKSLLQNITLVSQDTYLFNDTILANLKVGKQDASFEEVKAACKKAAIDEFIMNLKDGYDTLVGKLKDNFSAGEIQRIGLARAFLKNSPLILFDEPTSNVDSINEGIILKSIKDQNHDKSFIIISHRQSTMKIADRVYLLKEGMFNEEK